jgi:hypothetical protein
VRLATTLSVGKDSVGEGRVGWVDFGDLDGLQADQKDEPLLLSLPTEIFRAIREAIIEVMLLHAVLRPSTVTRARACPTRRLRRE